MTRQLLVQMIARVRVDAPQAADALRKIIRGGVTGRTRVVVKDGF
jgi:hypothetical protein